MRLLEHELETESPSAEADEDAVLALLPALVTKTFTLPGEVATSIHKGVTAQDFARAFGVGNDAEQVSEIDALGICVMCMKSMLRRIEALEAL